MVDLTSDLTSIPPVSVTVQGSVFLVRRNLTDADWEEFARLNDSQDDLGVLALVVGPTDAPKLLTLINSMPHEHAATVAFRVMAIARYGVEVADTLTGTVS